MLALKVSSQKEVWREGGEYMFEAAKFSIIIIKKDFCKSTITFISMASAEGLCSLSPLVAQKEKKNHCNQSDCSGVHGQLIVTSEPKTPLILALYGSKKTSNQTANLYQLYLAILKMHISPY